MGRALGQRETARDRPCSAGPSRAAYVSSGPPVRAGPAMHGVILSDRTAAIKPQKLPSWDG